jgi:putative tricarboxylic transport membrane protein
MSSIQTEIAGEERRRVLGLRTEVAVAILIAAALAVFIAATFGKTSAFAQASSGRGPFFFPGIVLGIMAALLPLVLVGLRNRVTALPERRPMLRMLSVMLATGLYCGLIEVLGFLIASLLFAAFVPLLLGRRDFLTIAIVAVTYAIAVWMLFEKVFLIILPASPLGLGF